MECIRSCNTKLKENINTKIRDVVSKNEMTYKEINTALVDVIYMLMNLNVVNCDCSKCKNIAELRDAIYSIISEYDLNKSDAIRILEEIKTDYNAMMIIQSILTKSKNNKPQPAIYL